jgi:hypothetical protein
VKVLAALGMALAAFVLFTGACAFVGLIVMFWHIVYEEIRDWLRSF